MTVTIKDFDRISKAYAEARTLAVDIKAIRDLVKNSCTWLDDKCATEIEAALSSCAERKKQAVIDVINAPVVP